MVLGFDNNLYIRTQSEKIRERIDKFNKKLYLEFGGKLFDDYHASRVLPGFAPDSKMQMLRELADIAEVVIVISADDIDKSKVRADLGITYDRDVLRLIDTFRKFGVMVGSVVISKFGGQAKAMDFERQLQSLDIKVFRHHHIEGYPSNVRRIVSEAGFGRNDYIETTRPLVVVTAPGPGSGKLAVCLSQLYHENKRGVKAGYAKFETFPVWNLPIHHPVNLAYEAATADLGDTNVIDPYYRSPDGSTAVNYNRDVEAFPILRETLRSIYGECIYGSPTEMSVNMAGRCITDDEVCRRAARAEIVRRYYAGLCDEKKGRGSEETVDILRMLMVKANLCAEDRAVVGAAAARSEETGGQPAMAIELQDGTVITGKTSELMGAASAAVLNAIKRLGGIPREVKLIEPRLIRPIQRLKTGTFGSVNPRLHSDETLIALSISAETNGPDSPAGIAMRQLPYLDGCDAHSTVILSSVDEDLYRRLGMTITCEPVYSGRHLFHR